MTVRVRGIYTTALTALLDDVVQASPPIRRRFDTTFPVEPAAASVTTTDDRQGVCVTGESSRVAEIVDQLAELGRDTFVWRGALPRGAVFAGEVVETLGSGAVVDCVAIEESEQLPDVPVAGDAQGFLPYSKTSRRIEDGDTLRVQVDEPRAPWSGGRPVLETSVRIHGELAALVRGKSTGSGHPELAEILPTDPPDGWGVEWDEAADDAGLDALGDVLDGLSERAVALDDALADATPVESAAPGCYWPGETTCWVWFGRESRFALDDIRREAVPTMPGHHRIKAGTRSASAAVDFVEAVCDDLGEGEPSESFPFEVVTDQFGPQEGASVHIDHGKPDGRLFELGTGEVTERSADGQVTVTREMSPGGTYDALGVERQAGDVAITKFKEGRWWYPTVYRGEDGQTRGTYVNVCTPVEIFPDAVRYVDLHVDVVKHADGTVERVDDDELDAAVAAGHISTGLAEKARTVADAIATSL